VGRIEEAERIDYLCGDCVLDVVKKSQVAVDELAGE